MQLIDDIDSFEPKASKILSQGLSPVCDHAGFDQGTFCCLGCQCPIFDKDDMTHQGSLLYSFRRPLNFSHFKYRFDVSGVYPRTYVDCFYCGQLIGHMESNWENNEKRFFVFSRSVYLEIIPIPLND